MHKSNFKGFSNVSNNKKGYVFIDYSFKLSNVYREGFNERSLSLIEGREHGHPELVSGSLKTRDYRNKLKCPLVSRIFSRYLRGERYDICFMRMVGERGR